MLRDAVCDEVTNNPTCLFDGGDCCLELKDTTLCQNCSCIMHVEPKKLHQKFIELEIKPLVNPHEFESAIGRWTVKVEDVISAQVCAVLCLEHDKADHINAWHFWENGRRTCGCGWIRSTLCPENLVKMEGRLLSVEKLSTNDTFVMLDKTLPCCKL